MIGAALLLLALEPPPAPPPPAPPVAVPLQFAPPLGQPMTYRVTSGRLARDGAMVRYTLVYALHWERAGRGVQLAAMLRRIESDARPELVQALTSLLRPLIGQTISYLAAVDGSRVDMIDPDAQWERVLGRVQSLGAGAAQGEARQVAGLLASLPPAEREKLATADIRALVAPANPAIADDASDLKIEQDGERRTLARIERPAPVDGPNGRQPFEIETIWTIDTATGLVLGERRRTWMTGVEGGARRLVEERIRDLAVGDPG